MRNRLMCAVMAGVFGFLGAAAGMSEEEIINGAQGRIEKYRKGQAVLRLKTSDGRIIGEGKVASIEQAGHEFLFGCNIFKLGGCASERDNAEYAREFSELLNYATLPFYWWNYSNTYGRMNDEHTDVVVKWCREHDITTKGHPLAWNYVDPRWLANDVDEAMKEQFARVGRCAGRFAGGIDIWDVVNEATHYDREECFRRAPKLTAGIKKMGVGAYLREAFAAARKANPDATLVINDYRTDQAYIDKVIKELVDDKGKALYDVIGIQSHMHGGYWGAKTTWDVCEKYAQFGAPLHFTETTIVSGPKTKDGWNSDAAGEERQARETAEFYTVLFSHPSVEAITWWDFTDQGAWQGAPAGFVRKDMTPKPVYDVLKGLIKDKWRTRAEAKIENGGEARFEGFYGKYKVEVEEGGRKMSGTFSFNKVTAGIIEVEVN